MNGTEIPMGQIIDRMAERRRFQEASQRQHRLDRAPQGTTSELTDLLREQRVTHPAPKRWAKRSKAKTENRLRRGR
jgi:hypothetical protein